MKKNQDGCIIDEVIRDRSLCWKAKERLKKRGVRGEKLDKCQCPWYINSPYHCFCFWVYVLDENNQKEHQLTQIAKLLKTSVNNIKLIEVRALEKVKSVLTHLIEEKE